MLSGETKKWLKKYVLEFFKYDLLLTLSFPKYISISKMALTLLNWTFHIRKVQIIIFSFRLYYTFIFEFFSILVYLYVSKQFILCLSDSKESPWIRIWNCILLVYLYFPFILRNRIYFSTNSRSLCLFSDHFLHLGSNRILAIPSGHW